ncbi:transposase [Thiovibrio sp. JS02]
MFKDDTDRQEFLELLARSLAIYSVKLYSFVLMNNHFHLLVETPLGNLSQFMRHFNISYTSAFNRRHRRSGHLYQGRYKSFLVDRDAYLSMVSRYIHLNPVKIGSNTNKPLAEQLDILWAYKWSSLPGFVSLKKRWTFVDYPVVLAEFGGDTAVISGDTIPIFFAKENQAGSPLQNNLTNRYYVPRYHVTKQLNK